MTNKRSARMALLACASVASLGLLVGASPAAAKTKTRTVNQCLSTNAAIPDNLDTAPAGAATASIPVSVPKFNGRPQTGVVTAFTSAGVRIVHTDDGDLVLGLVSPSGQVILLSNSRDGNTSGDGYGTGAASCSGSLVLFGDTFPTPIRTPGNTTTGSPITGSFQPEQPLSSFLGGAAKGNWTLFVADAAGGDVGTINAFSLNFSFKYKVAPKKKK
jgi:subtilisin-like proprotein convertase family protein